MSAKQPTVLFLCADNSVRSQMGEALLRHHGGDRFDAQSAGLAPKPVHPLVSEVLRELGLDSEQLAPKRIGPLLAKQRVGYAIILRDPDETDAPRIFPFATRTLRWEVGDPASPDAGNEDTLQRFRRVRDEIDVRVRALVAEIESQRPSSAA